MSDVGRSSGADFGESASENDVYFAKPVLPERSLNTTPKVHSDEELRGISPVVDRLKGLKLNESPRIVSPLQRKWDENKLTQVRCALRQRGDIRRLVSKFESLSEDAEESRSTNSKPLFPKSNLVLPRYRRSYSPSGFSTARFSTSSRAIDKMFDFVEKADMITPRSSIAIRRSSSINRLPLATSTPICSNKASDGTQKSSGNSAVSDEQIFREKNKALLHDIGIQKEQISQAVEAIRVCQKKHDFNGTEQELSAQRILLVANERRLLLNQEMDKLNEAQTLRQLNKGKFLDLLKKGSSAMVITSISVHLNRDFYIKAKGNDASFVFVVLAKCEGAVYATQLLEVKDMGTIRANTIQVHESIRFDHLPADFVVTLEVYAVKLVRRQAHAGVYSSTASKFKAMIGVGKKAISHGPDGSAPKSEFNCCGMVRLNRESAGKQQFVLLNAVYPLEGTIVVRATHASGNRKSSFEEHLR